MPMTTTIVRYDDATLAEIQRRFRAGRPPESGRRKRHSRCDVIVSLHPEIEQLLNEGYTFDAIAQHFAAVDVVIEVATLKNYVGLARRKPGGTSQLPSPTGRRNAGAEPGAQRTKTRHADAQRTQRKPSARPHAAPTAEALTAEMAMDAAPSVVATAEPTAPADQRSAPSEAQDVPRTAAATSPELATDGASAPAGIAEPQATNDEAPRSERGEANSPVRECSDEVAPGRASSTSPETSEDEAEVRRPQVNSKPVTAAAPMRKIGADTPHTGANQTTRRAFTRETASTERNDPLEMPPRSLAASTETSSSFPVPRRKRLADL